MGTPLFMSPEMLAGEYDEKTDVWSMGVILYFCITQVYPFDGSCRETLYKNILARNVNYLNENLDNYDPLVIDLMKKMLTKDPKDRISAEECMNHEWVTKYEHHDTKLRGIKRNQHNLNKLNKRLKSNVILQVIHTFLNETEIDFFQKLF